MTRRTIRALVATAALAVVTTLGACGSADPAGGGGAAGSLGAGVGAPSEASSTGATGPADAQAAPDAATGDVVAFADVAAKAAKAAQAAKTVHVTGTGPAGAMNGQIDYANRAISYSSKIGQGEAKAIFVDDVLYIGNESFAALTGGKGWIKFDPDSSSPMSTAMKPILDQVFSMIDDPMKGLEAVAGLTATVTEVGSAGTTYEVRLTADQVRQMNEAMLKDSPIGAAGAAAANYQPVTIVQTIGPDGLPVKVVTTVQEGAAPLSLTYGKWGEPVTISPPPADQVGTL